LPQPIVSLNGSKIASALAHERDLRAEGAVAVAQEDADVDASVVGGDEVEVAVAVEIAERDPVRVGARRIGA